MKILVIVMMEINKEKKRNRRKRKKKLAQNRKNNNNTNLNNIHNGNGHTNNNTNNNNNVGNDERPDLREYSHTFAQSPWESSPSLSDDEIDKNINKSTMNETKIASNKKSCKLCTFHNNIKAKKCTMCG
eukprot:30394_1